MEKDVTAVRSEINNNKSEACQADEHIEDECVECCRFSERENRFDGLRAAERHIATEKFRTSGYYPRERTPVRLQNIYKMAVYRTG